MKRIVSGVFLGLVVAGCSAPPVRQCTDSCDQGQRCDATTGLCVKDAVPTLAVEPVPNPLLTKKLTVRGTTTDDLGVTRGEAFFEGQTPVVFTVTENAFSVELDTPENDSVEARLIVRVFDTGGQVAETTVKTVVDTLGPSVALTPPDTVIGGAVVTVQGSSHDGSGAVAEVQADFGPGPVTATLNPDGAWTVQLAPPGGRDAVATPITITAKDQYGNRSTSELSLKIDTVGPTFMLTAPTATVGGAATVVSGTVIDSSGPIAMVSVRFGGLAQDVATTSGAFSATVMLPQGIDGETRAVTFSAVDGFGNAGSGSFELNLDTRGPDITLVGPMIVGPTATLTGNASDTHGPLSNVTVDLNDGTGPRPVDSLSNGIWQLAAAFVGGQDGVTRQVALSATDALGNVGTGAGSFVIDTTPPTGTFTTPAEGATLSGPAATISGTVQDNTSAILAVSLDFADGQPPHAATVSGTTWTVDVPLGMENHQVHATTARFTDAVGNSSVAYRSFVVDTVGPAVTITTPTAGSLVGGSDTTLAVAFTATDPSSVIGAVVHFGGAPMAAAARQGTTNTWTATVQIPAGLDYVATPLEVRATDGAGNVGSAIVTLTVDNVAPVLTITAPSAGQVFNIASFTASANVNIAWTVTDGDPQARVTTVGGAPVASGTSAAWPTVATDNYTTYSVPVAAVDRMNNASSQLAMYIVDRVAPTVTISPGNGTRNVEPREAVLTFSEEVRGPVDPLVLSPASSAPAGAWQGASRITFTRSGLEPYRVFTASLASGLTDRAGNAVSATSSRFHTSAAIPASGTAIDPLGSTWGYDVVSDLDGIPLVVQTKLNGSSWNVVSKVLDPTSGTFIEFWQDTNSYVVVYDYHAFAWTNVQADLSAVPSRGYYVQSRLGPTLVDDIRWKESGNSYSSTVGWKRLIATPAISPADGTGTTGLVDSVRYTRAPSTSVNLGNQPSRLAVSAGRWNVAEKIGGTIRVSSYRCTSQIVFPNISYYCGLVTSDVVADADSSTAIGWARNGAGVDERLSMATAENGCTMLSYPSASGVMKVASIADNVSRAPCSGLCQQSLSTSIASAPSDNFAVGKGPGNVLLGTGFQGGQIQLYQSADCSTWQPVGAPLAYGSALPRAKPAQVGNRRGFFYVDATTGALRVYIP